MNEAEYDEMLKALKSINAMVSELTGVVPMVSELTKLVPMMSELGTQVSEFRQEFRSVSDTVQANCRRIDAIRARGGFQVFPTGIQPTSRFLATERHGIVGRRVVVGYTG